MCDCGNSRAGRYFATIGGQVGDRITGLGEGAISMASKRFKEWTGLGDYKITYNSLINTTGTPPFASSSSRGLIIRHKEYLGDVVTSPVAVGAFNLVKWNVNPGNVLTFPWLCPVAQQYDQYRPRGIIFEFVSTASETSTTASLGSVVFSTQYDVTDADPTSKGEMLNRSYSNEVKMSEDSMHGLECDPNELQTNLYYCRPFGTSPAVGGTDSRDFDMANFYLATQGGTLPVSTIVGSLYVHYEFEFFKQVPIGGLNNRSMLWANYLGTIAPSTTVNFSNMALVVSSGRAMGATFSGLTMTIPKYWAGSTMKFTLQYRNTSANVTSNNPTVPTVVNCSLYTNTTVAVNQYWSVIPYASGVTSAVIFELLITVNSNINTDATITWPGTLANMHTTTAATGTNNFQATLEVVSKDYILLQ